MSIQFPEKVGASLNLPKDVAAREGAVLCCHALHTTLGLHFEPSAAARRELETRLAEGEEPRTARGDSNASRAPPEAVRRGHISTDFAQN